MRKASPRSATSWMCRQSYTPFVLHTITLLGFVIASTYAGTSNLFAAYLAGASISWWDSEIQHPSPSIIGATSPTVEEAETPQIRDTQLTTSQVPINAMHIDSEESSMSSQLEVGTLPGPELNQVHQVRDKTKEARDIGRCGIAVYHAYYGQAVQRILKPFFFVCCISSWLSCEANLPKGLYWFCNSSHRDVFWCYLLAERRLHSVNALWQSGHWPLAGAYGDAETDSKRYDRSPLDLVEFVL